MEILLEVIFERKIQKWCAGGSEFHGCCQSTLNEGQIAGSQMAVQIGYKCTHLHAVRKIKTGRVQTGAHDHDHTHDHDHGHEHHHHPYPHAKHPMGPESVRKYLKGSGE